VGNEKQIAKLNHEFESCFGSNQSTLTIYQEDSIVIAKLVSDNKPPIESILDKQKIDRFNQFIKELRNLKEEGGCTTVEYYSMYFKNEFIKKTDGSCDWDGFINLQKDLFDMP
jgi:hypothetical protein